MTSFNNYVDPILSALKDGSRKHIYSVIDYHVPEMNKKAERVILIDYLKDKGLIRECRDNNEWEVKITPFGYQIYASGGWLKYLAAIEEQSKASQKERTEAKSIEKKRFGVTSLLTFLGLVFLAYGVYQTERSYTLDKELQKVLQERDSLSIVTDSLLDLLRTKPAQSPDSLPP